MVSLLSRVPTPTPPSTVSDHEIPDEDDGNLTDLLGETRVLLSGVQTMTAFLILLPFNGGFSEVDGDWRPVYIITFVCALLSMVLFTAPAAHHRIHHPVLDRKDFKMLSTRYMIAGMVPLTIATFMVTQLVFSVIIPIAALAWVSAGALAVLLLVMWWFIPLRRKRTTRKT
ncbi:hypothetical protein BH20CHL2_BH20CHL2_02080 [soil metagenome]